MTVRIGSQKIERMKRWILPSSRVVLRSNNNANANGGVAYANANNDSSNANTNYGSRLANIEKEVIDKKC